MPPRLSKPSATSHNFIRFSALFFFALALVIIFLFYQPQTNNDISQGKATQATQDKYPKETVWVRFSTDPVAVLTLFLVVIGAAQAGLFYWQLNLIRESVADTKEAVKAAKRQVELTRESLISTHRSWISVTVRIVSDMVVDENGARVSISVDYKNIGKTPALNVFCLPHLCARTNDRQPRDLIDDIMKITPRFQKVGGLGLNIPPKETISIIYNASISPEEIETGGLGRSTKPGFLREGSTTHMSIDVYGVVLYSDAISTHWHRMPFWYNMTKTDGSGSYPKSNSVVNARDMILKPEMFGAQIVD